MYICIHIHIHIHTYTHSCICMYAHTYTDTYMHTHTRGSAAQGCRSGIRPSMHSLNRSGWFVCADPCRDYVRRAHGRCAPRSYSAVRPRRQALARSMSPHDCAHAHLARRGSECAAELSCHRPRAGRRPVGLRGYPSARRHPLLLRRGTACAGCTPAYLAHRRIRPECALLVVLVRIGR